MFWHNNHYIFVPGKFSLFTACKYVGKVISRFCYHDNLPVAGNCRACLVELQNFDKPTASCVAELEFDQSIWTESLFSKKARENVFEILLINHPLDCPICDQAGECDLQDQSKVFGGLTSRYFLKKRSVFDKHCDFLIKTIMTRCIHCTRCVRFNSLIGNSKIGILSRGTTSTIGNYFFRNIQSGLLANVIDLCPVGALTARINAFATRPWEIILKEGLDLTDGLGSNVYFGVKDLTIVKVLPKPNKLINGNIITDTCRFFFKTLKINRLNKLQSFSTINLNYYTLGWFSFFQKIDILNKSSKNISIMINEKLNLLTLIFLKKLSNKSQNKIKISSNRISSKFNYYLSALIIPVSDLEKQLNNCFVYSNLAKENHILNFKLKLKYQKTLLNILCIGYSVNSSFNNFGLLNIKYFLKKTKAKSLYSLIFLRGLFSMSVTSKNFDARANNFKSFSFIQKRQLYTSKNLNITTLCNEEGFELMNVSTNSLKFNLHSTLFCVQLNDNLNFRKNILNSNKSVIWLNSYKPLVGTFIYLIPVSTVFEEKGLYVNLEQKKQVFNKVLNSTDKNQNVISVLGSIFSFNAMTELAWTVVCVGIFVTTTPFGPLVAIPLCSFLTANTCATIQSSEGGVSTVQDLYNYSLAVMGNPAFFETVHWITEVVQ